jgi:hypothetical protein
MAEVVQVTDELVPGWLGFSAMHRSRGAEDQVADI